MRDLSIAYGNSCQAKFWTNKTISWEDLCEKLATTIRTSETVEEYSKMKKTDREAAKDKGGFVAGQLKDNRRKIENVVSRSMLTLDMDQAEVGFIERLKDELNCEAVIYTTHSHTPETPRIRMIIPLSRDVSPDEYVAIARFFANELGIDQFDECSYKPNQLMYWPTSPSNAEFLCKRFEGEWLNPDEYLAKHPNWKDCSLLPTSSRESKVAETSKKPQEDPLIKKGIIGAFCRTYSISDAIEKFLSDVYVPSVVEGRFDYIPGEGCAGVVVYDDKYAYSHHATDPACGKLLNAFDLIRVHKFGDDDKKSYTAMCEFAASDEEVKMRLFEERQLEAEEDFADDGDDEWKKKLRYSAKTFALENSIYNLNLILANDPNLKSIVFNQLADGMEIVGDVPWKHPAKFWRDADDAQLICYVDAHYGNFSARNYDVSVTKTVDDRSYHPIKEFFNSLPEWDGVKRIETMLIDYFGADDNGYVRSISKKIMCAAIVRIFNPGCKFDYILVMNGPQGIGKSTFISKLGMQWYSDSLNLSDMNDKTAAEKLQGYWILEIGELAGMKKADIDKVKAFISRQDDKYRASFGRRVTSHPRQCIFFGTTNSENGFLRDITGNRRFWTVKTPGTGKKKPWDITQDEVNQMWAEALTYVKEGESLFLPVELEGFARDEQSGAMEQDDREGIVSEYLDMLLPENWDSMDVYQRRDYARDPNGELNVKGTIRRDTVSNIEIWCECFGKPKEDLRPTDSYAISAIMARMANWEKANVSERIPIYGRQRVYKRK